MRKNILCIEDDLDKNIKEDPTVSKLERVGFSADAAYDGTEAEEKLMQKRYDCIYIDIMLPHGEKLSKENEIRRRLGIYLIKNIKAGKYEANGAKSDTPLLIVTGIVEYNDVDEVRSLLQETDFFMEKPVHPRDIAEKVKKLLSEDVICA